ncbi:Solute carrier family 25 member 39-like protein 2 [Colletotrichum chlorophyti]|uniref:Solute carrier family 25 member 39-like protein 2 n=1 Tax=Colletotrichum chlorophyti TaxID=708187 RepID=A0A1Q8RA97_9PEZI|nr:Solute carrier family 25 member 39-like protein 2 [Colletotrichum chlorophyti]
MTPRRNDDTILYDPYTGVLPVLPPDAQLPDKNPRSNAATAASAAGVRALSAQAIAFYFRAPVKAFFRTRVDYLAYARSVHLAQTELLAQAAAKEPLSRLGHTLRQAWFFLRGTTPGVLTSAVKQHGWSVLPNQVLPPLIANVGVGAVLYTSYLQILGTLHEESAKAKKTVYPPPQPIHTFTAGFLAGSLQSFVAAPLDAIQARYDHRDLIPADGGKPRSMWAFSAEKLRDIGLRGIFAGWALSLMKDSFGCAIFFSVFEYVKAQGYYRFVSWYYGGLEDHIVDFLVQKRPLSKDTPEKDTTQPLIIRPHYAIEPLFLLLGGISASFAQQVVLHPLTHVQVEHWDRLEELDARAEKWRQLRGTNPTQPRQRWRMFNIYYRAYEKTWSECCSDAAKEGLSVRRWLWRGFWWNTIRQVPSTSAGLIIFELVRRKYGLGSEEVRITGDGYDILLN